MKILDSSVIVAFFRNDELDHNRATWLFKGDEDYLVPDYVLAEVVTVLKKREGLEIAKSALDLFTSVDGIKIYETQPELFWSAMSFFAKNKNNLSFVDTLILTFARENQLSVVTFDKELKKMLK